MLQGAGSIALDCRVKRAFFEANAVPTAWRGEKIVPESSVVRRPTTARRPTRLRSRAPWRLSDIDYAAIDRSQVINDPTLLTLVTMASFVETGSDLYAHVLISYFDQDPEVAGWLAQSWEHEEVQHGAALRKYVEHVWPDFDWRTVYDTFFEEYAKTCTLPDLEPSHGLELAARCVVEMGTATLYSSLHDYVQEPVLKDLAARIYADEVRHYKHFYRYFRRYQQRERHGRWRVGRTLAKRMFASRDDDGYCAYRHVWRATRTSEGGSVEGDYQAFLDRVGTLARRHAPRELPVDMLLRPLQLPAPALTGAKAVARTIYRFWLHA
jgi:hypothetical protein